MTKPGQRITGKGGGVGSNQYARRGVSKAGGVKRVVVKTSENQQAAPVFTTLKDATAWAKANGAETVISDPKIAAKRISEEVDGWVSSMVKQGRINPGDAPKPAEVEANWLKVFRSKKENEGGVLPFKNLNQELGLTIQNSINDNATNSAFLAFTKHHGEVPVVYRAAEKGRSCAAEWRGATHVYESPFWKGEGTETLKPGQATAGGMGGYSAVLRHEYGHKLYGKLTPEQAREWSESVDSSQVASGLTSYAAKNKEETFCELFAIVTDRRYRKGVFPSWVDELHAKQKEWLLK